MLMMLYLCTVYVVYLAVALIWWFGESRKYRQIKRTPLGCKHGFLSIVGHEQMLIFDIRTFSNFQFRMFECLTPTH